MRSRLGVAVAVFSLMATACEEIDIVRLNAHMFDPRAQARLAQKHLKGEDLPQDYAEAERWYRKAAERGLPEAQFGLARMYQRGQGVDRDPIEAARLIQLAAESGYPLAQYELGVLYLNGTGVERDPGSAHVWFHVAGLTGMSDALNMLPEVEALMDRESIAEARQRAKEIYLEYQDGEG